MLPIGSSVPQEIEDLPLDAGELGDLVGRDERQWPGRIIVGPDFRQLPAAAGNELLLDRIVPLDRFANPNRPLRFDDLPGKLANLFFVSLFVGAGHRGCWASSTENRLPAWDSTEIYHKSDAVWRARMTPFVPVLDIAAPAV